MHQSKPLPVLKDARCKRVSLRGHETTTLRNIIPDPLTRKDRFFFLFFSLSLQINFFKW